jgi:hypothetical protein
MSPQVRSEHCKLSWEVPEDDGGCPIQGYLVHMLDLEVNEWVLVAETTTETRAEIRGLRPGHLYR